VVFDCVTSTEPLIWIVDDSRTQGAFTARGLGDGYRFEMFEDGASVIERLAVATDLPALVLLDWVMPGLSGDEVCRFLRSAPQTEGLPIIILTASRTDSRDIVQAFESGANDYLTKPFVPEELRARVQCVLRIDELKHTVERERNRVAAMNRLATALFRARSEVQDILDVVAEWMIASVGDGCAVSLVRDGEPTRTSVKHRTAARAASLTAATANLVPAVRTLEAEEDACTDRPELASYVVASGVRGVVVQTLSIRGIASGVVVVTRDGVSNPFDERDIAAITTCLEYSGLALDAALRSEGERATTRFHEEMVGIVGHDLRNPLSALGLGIGLLQEQTTDPTASSVLARLDRTAQRMTLIVNQLLDVTRVKLGAGIPVQRRAMWMRPMVDAVLEELQVVHKTSQFRVAGPDVEGHWDPDRLEQVIGNLASNALQYGRAGTPVMIGLGSDGTSALLSVCNELVDQPIPPALLETLFDPFKRGRSSDVRGLGLGLYIAHEIVRAHHGTLSVESSLAGTTFNVSIPIHHRA
jgi:K+-sensing histidine kinase KdpD